MRKQIFNKHFRTIKDYIEVKKKPVPHSSVSGMYLYKLRKLKQYGELDQEYIDRLESIKGFKWVEMTAFDRNLKRFKEYLKENDEYPPSITKLGGWVSRMRTQYRSGILPVENEKKLKIIKFKFNT